MWTKGEHVPPFSPHMRTPRVMRDVRVSERTPSSVLWSRSQRFKYGAASLGADLKWDKPRQPMPSPFRTGGRVMRWQSNNGNVARVQ